MPPDCVRDQLLTRWEVIGCVYWLKPIKGFELCSDFLKSQWLSLLSVVECFSAISQYGISGCHPLFLVPQSVELGTFNPTLSSRPLWNPITARKSSTNSTTSTSTGRLLVSCVHFLAEEGGWVINPSIFLNHLSMNGQILRQISYISNVLYLKLVLESIDIVDIGWRSAWWSLWNDKNRYYTDRIIVIMSYVYNSNQILWEQIFKLTLRVVTRTT